MAEFLQHKFTVEGILKTTDFDIRMNLKKRLFHFGYKSASSKSKVNLSYLSTAAVAARDPITLVDRSTSLPANRSREGSGYIVFRAGSFSTHTTAFLITDTFATQQATQTNIPLFYTHTLENFNPANSDWASRTLVDIQFADYSLATKLVSAYSVESTTGKVYNNLENSYNSSTGELDVTYVVYSVKIVDGSSTYIQTYHELLNNTPAFIPATFSDLDDTGVLSTTAHAYLLQEAIAGTQFTVTLPSTTTWAYTEETLTHRLYPRVPASRDRQLPWFPSIANGEIIAPIKIGSTWRNHKYRIAEFMDQTFDPAYPYKYYTQQHGEILYDNLVQFSRNITLSDTQPLQILIWEEDKTIWAAYTTDSSLIGTAYDSTINWSDGILSIDQRNGFVELQNQLPVAATLEGAFYSECDEYEFTDVNLNSLSNPDVLTGRTVLYITPETLYTGSLTESVWYLNVDNDGRIIYCAQAAAGNAGSSPSTAKLLDEDFYLDGTPKHDFYYDLPSTASGLLWRPTGVYSAFNDEFSFVDKYTTENTYSLIASGLTGTYLQNLQENPQFLLLGDVYVGAKAGLHEQEIIDIRVRGGGIQEEEEENALEQQGEILNNWDLAARRFYPGAFSFFVEVPQSILQDHDGAFTLPQVKDIVSRHIQTGSYPVIRSYADRSPFVQSGVVSSGTIAIGWASYGSDSSYDIYLSTAIDRGYELVGPGLLDSIAGNSYEINELVPATKYYVYIKATTPTEEANGLPVSFTTLGYRDEATVAVYDSNGIYDVSVYL